MATMKQIAQLAGVSRGTVDRVLNKRGVVKKETADKIREIAQLLNYVPNKAARSLATHKTNPNFGFILADRNNPFYEQIRKGIEKKAAELTEYGITVDIEYGAFSNPSIQDKLLLGMASRGITGIGLCGFGAPSTARIIRELREKGIYVVTSNTDIPDSGRLAFVGFDYEKAGRVAAQLVSLIKKGPANVAVLFGSRSDVSHSEWMRGFRSYISEHAVNIHVKYVEANSDDDFKSFAIVTDIIGKDPSINILLLASAGIYGACRAVEILPVAQRPCTICYDCVPSTQDMMRKGIISATICQQLEYQGAKPLDILFNALCLASLPEEERFLSEISIKISECL